ncbi:MAG: hypothetical protein FE038_02075 [Thermoplasmata archaeon]|nr:MAG: hypothetical protein FE038_02075 [Thermoplasmata archaeon]
MTKFIGRRQSVGIGVETTRGVGVSPSYWLNVLSFSHADKVEKARTAGSLGGIWGGDQALVTLKRAEGDMEVEMGSESFGAILLAVLGNVSTSTDTPAAGLNTHTFTLQNDNQHDSLSITTTDPIGDLIFELAMIETLEIRVTPEDLVTLAISFKSKSSQSSSATVSYSAEHKFLGRHLTFKVASDTSGLDAASKISLKSLTLTFNKNLELDNVLGSVQPEDILNKNFQITGELELNYEDRTWANYMLNGSYKAVRIELENTDVTASPYSASNHPKFVIDLSKVDFEAWEPSLSPDDIATQTITFTALYDLGGNDNVINNCQLINEVTSY